MHRKGKYNNKIVYKKDGKFDSQKEYTFWLKLKRQEEMGLIRNLTRQVPFLLIEKSKFGREIKYIADFVYVDNKTNEVIVSDCKSEATITQEFKLKARIFAEKYGFEIKILK